MGVSVGKLRVGLLAGAGLLVVVIAAFLGYSHFLAHRFLVGLPKKLGIDIKQETNGFTYSQSLQGKTVYTLHASKALQHNDGQWTLHDVGIVLYGRKEDRADHIYGNQFEYNQATGEVRAVGPVQIDLAAPAAAFHGRKDGGIRESGSIPGQPDSGVIHVRTSGLVFHEKTRTASTDQQIDFQSGGLTGHARGADYSSETGVILLRAEVTVSGLMANHPVDLTASRAELNQKDHIAVLSSARYVSHPPGGASRVLSADHAVIHTSEDGAPQQVESSGHVVLSTAGGGTLSADRADAVLHEGKPESVHLFGGLRFADRTGPKDTSGEAQEGRVAFDRAGQASHITLSAPNGVALREILASPSPAPPSRRELHASRVDLSLSSDGHGHSLLRQADAAQGARLHLEDPPTGSKARTVADLTGDLLTAHFDAVGNVARITDLHGSGHTSIHRSQDASSSGPLSQETSTGDTLEVSFRPVPSGAPTAANSSRMEIQRAIQRGSVNLVRTLSAPASIQHASGNEAIYDADANNVVLTGAAQVSDESSALWAQRIVMDNASGNASAEGTVRASYLPASNKPAASQEATHQEPAHQDAIHIVAEHATLERASGTAIFRGKLARMWQGTSQVEAPVLELNQTRKTLFAHGEGTAEVAAVHAVLAPTPQAHPAAAGHQPSTGSGASRPPAGGMVAGGPVRVTAREMTYTDALRRVEFRGGVRLDDANGSMRSQSALVTLQPATLQPATQQSNASPASSPPGTTSTALLPSGKVDRIVATGKVEIEQPGRLATGEQLIYTAADNLFVLTGTHAAPPKVVDQTQGTITGDSMRFKSGEDSIVVSGGSNGSQRVHSETRIKQ